MSKWTCQKENSLFNQPLREWDCVSEKQTDRQTDRASLCILTAPALGQPVHVSEGPLNNELSLPRHWHWLLSSPLLLLSCTSSAPSLSLLFFFAPPPSFSTKPQTRADNHHHEYALSPTHCLCCHCRMCCCCVLPYCRDRSGGLPRRKPEGWMDALLQKNICPPAGVVLTATSVLHAHWYVNI